MQLSNPKDVSTLRLLDQGIILFNGHPKDGILFLIRMGILPDDPLAIARFLLTHPELDKKAIGNFIGRSNELSLAVLNQFACLVDYTSLSVDKALRTFTSRFAMPGESQQVYRILERFSVYYAQCNPPVDKEKVHVLSYAIIMLNVDAHNSNVKEKMTKEQFVKNVYGALDGAFSKEQLESVYAGIVSEEMRPDVTEAEVVYSRIAMNPRYANAPSNNSMQRSLVSGQSTHMDLNELRKGAVFLKFCRSGAVHMVFLSLSDDGRSIRWRRTTAEQAMNSWKLLPTEFRRFSDSPFVSRVRLIASCSGYKSPSSRMGSFPLAKLAGRLKGEGASQKGEGPSQKGDGASHKGAVGGSIAPNTSSAPSSISASGQVSTGQIMSGQVSASKLISGSLGANSDSVGPQRDASTVPHGTGTTNTALAAHTPTVPHGPSSSSLRHSFKELPLDQVTGFVTGSQGTAVFRRANVPKEYEGRCFSIVGFSRTVDFMSVSSTDVKPWLQFFHSVLSRRSRVGASAAERAARKYDLIEEEHLKLEEWKGVFASWSTHWNCGVQVGIAMGSIPSDRNGSSRPNHSNGSTGSSDDSNAVALIFRRIAGAVGQTSMGCMGSYGLGSRAFAQTKEEQLAHRVILNNNPAFVLDRGQRQESASTQRLVSLWLAGLPTVVREKLWPLAVGDVVRVTEKYIAGLEKSRASPDSAIRQCAREMSSSSFRRCMRRKLTWLHNFGTDDELACVEATAANLGLTGEGGPGAFSSFGPAVPGVRRSFEQTRDVNDRSVSGSSNDVTRSADFGVENPGNSNSMRSGLLGNATPPSNSRTAAESGVTNEPGRMIHILSTTHVSSSNNNTGQNQFVSRASSQGDKIGARTSSGQDGTSSGPSRLIAGSMGGRQWSDPSHGGKPSDLTKLRTDSIMDDPNSSPGSDSRGKAIVRPPMPASPENGARNRTSSLEPIQAISEDSDESESSPLASPEVPHTAGLSPQQRTQHQQQVSATRSEGPHTVFLEHSTKAIKAAVTRIVACLVAHRPDIGYVEGMAHLATLIVLAIGRTEFTTHVRVMLNVVQNNFWFDFYTWQWRKIRTRFDLFETLLAERLPHIEAHLRALQLTPDLYFLQWILTGFFRVLPLRLALITWDSFILLGESHLFTVSLALMLYHEHRIMVNGFSGCLEVLLGVADDDSFQDGIFMECVHAMTVPAARYATWISAQRLSEEKADLCDLLFR